MWKWFIDLAINVAKKRVTSKFNKLIKAQKLLKRVKFYRSKGLKLGEAARKVARQKIKRSTITKAKRKITNLKTKEYWKNKSLNTITGGGYGKYKSLKKNLNDFKNGNDLSLNKIEKEAIKQTFKNAPTKVKHNVIKINSSTVGDHNHLRNPSSVLVDQLFTKIRILEELGGGTVQALRDDRKIQRPSPMENKTIKAIMTLGREMLEEMSEKGLQNLLDQVDEEFTGMGIKNIKQMVKVIEDEEFKTKMQDQISFELHMENWDYLYHRYDPKDVNASSRAEMELNWEKIKASQTKEKYLENMRKKMRYMQGGNGKK